MFIFENQNKKMLENETYNKARVVSFTDAVFSIAVTLLVLEIVIPGYSEFSKYNTLEILQNRIPSFIGLIVSFFGDYFILD